MDVCTISMLGTKIAQRVAFFWSSPLTSSLLHWLVGIVYMLQISIFVSLLRGVLRPGVLYLLRDPADTNYNPFRDLIDHPIHKHARRVLLSVLVYGRLIVMLVFFPVKVAMYFSPSIFPLDISVSDPFTEIMQDAVIPSMSALVKPELLRHQDKDVRLIVVTCISEITRITAPEAPYNDDLMREIFQLIVGSLQGLDQMNSPTFGRRVTILETVAKVRSCVVMLNLQCDNLILDMFQHFLASASENHTENVSASMQTIMSLV